MAKIYANKEVKEFKQSPGKIYCLHPSFDRHLPDGKNKKILDVGCGDGFYYKMCTEKGFKYFGIDISKDMLNKAKTNFSDGIFLEGSCFELSKFYERESFDVVISSMLLPEFELLTDIRKTLNEINRVLKKGGVFLLGVGHPAFDMYMRKFLFNADNVETDFYSYYDSAKLYKVVSKNMGVVFEDHHWTFEDYINELVGAGFEIKMVDECKIVDEAKEADGDFYAERIKVPSYVLFKAEKK